LVLAATLSYSLLPEGASLKEGSVAPLDFAAPRSDVDSYQTAELRRQAAAAVPIILRFDSSRASAAATALEKVVSEVKTILADTSLDQEARLRGVTGKLPGSPPAQVASQAAALGPDGWEELGKRIVALTVAELGNRFGDEGVQSAREQLAREIAKVFVTKELGTYLTSLAQQQVVATLMLDAEETQRQRDAAAQAVAPVMILREQIIARRGDLLTAHQVALIRDLGLMRARLEPRAIAGSLLLAVLLVSAVLLYLRLYEGDAFRNASQLLLLALVVSLVLVITQVTKGLSPYLAPVALGTMLMTSLLNPRLALFVAFVLSIGVGLITGGSLDHALVALVGGTVGVYSLSWVGQRSDLTRAGILVGVANVLTVVALDLVSGASLASLEAWRQLGYALLNGIASAVLTIGTLPFFESAFGVLTAIRLLELANPNQPLLRRLLVEAPGTYHHSIVVGNLAEAGADAVGANPVLARVGAYYHDIGKITRPYFFIENQMGQENPHDKISASLSTLIITSHVKDGIALAEEAKLPSQVVSFIRSHHGKSLVSYFYSRAAENGQTGQRLGEEDFRYDGPLPETREEALVMLADSCEAAVRAMPQPDQGRIDATVRRIIRERLVDGQLEKCDLTLRDLDRVADVFIRVLVGIFHARIEYPQDSERLIREIGSGKPERDPAGPAPEHEKASASAVPSPVGHSGAPPGTGGAPGTNGAARTGTAGNRAAGAAKTPAAPNGTTPVADVADAAGPEKSAPR
jgi:hypothetical protein